ncbi:DUF3606 domain-containing protein [Dokdonella sp.]|uniref:DUF3606 domain-containing protein n=1 Tax=Dokdonella sp. TaxID=2291710 RepID=UPI001B123AE2|nr:DUF3606 domain-containing protein [Dokdonella sp.]MBO9661881.1 DUF3606 domain-containing protein [Dokdonella sp.]
MTQLNKPRLVSERQTTAVFSSDAPSAAERRSTVAAQDVCDTARVDIENWHSRRYWSERLGLSETQLARAVRAAGAAVVQIERYLAERRARRAQRRRESTRS